MKIILILLLLISINIYAKILAPKNLESITYNTYIINFPIYVKNSKQQGGWVQVLDFKSKKQICLKKIYTTSYRENLEMDVQHNFIKRYKHHGEIITLYDSHNNVHKLIISDICKNNN